MAFVIVHAEKVEDGTVKKGILLYPSCQGQFRSEEKQTKFSALFQDTAPKLPFAGAGKRFGPETFTDEEKHTCILEYLKKEYSLPKDVDSYWEKDEAMHNDLVFPLMCPWSDIRVEHPKEAAMRGLWQCTGLKVPHLTYIGCLNDKHVYSTTVYVDHAKWEWMNHQAERRTLTDWDVCSHFKLLDELGVPGIVLESYCRTHGGPRFVTDIHDHLVDDTTKELLLHFFTPTGVLKESASSKE